MSVEIACLLICVGPLPWEVGAVGRLVRRSVVSWLVWWAAVGWLVWGTMLRAGREASRT